jgi:hypothetical protein
MKWIQKQEENIKWFSFGGISHPTSDALVSGGQMTVKN